MKCIFQIFLVFIFSIINFGASLNISIISDTQYGDAQKNCTSEFSGTLIPFQILQSNASSVLKALEVNDTAWTGLEKFAVGCQNETETEQNRICTDIKHERVPTSFKLNYTCVANDQVMMTSNEAKTYSDSQSDCKSLSSSVAKLDNQHQLYKLPKSIQVPDRGKEWFETVETDYLKSSLIRRCQFVRKTDECSLRVEFGDCDDARKGICYTDEDMSYQSSLKFVEFHEIGNITARDRVDISEEDLCSVSTVTTIKETTEHMPPSTQEYTTTTIRPRQFSDNPNDETSATETTRISTGGTSVGVYSTIHAVPAEPRKPSSESNNLWIIAVVIISLLVIMIIVLIMVLRHKRRVGKGTILEHDGEKRTSTSDVSAPVTGSLRRFQATSVRPFGTDSGIEVLGRDMFSGLQSENIEITDLDEEIKETQLNDNGALRELNVMTENNDNQNISTESQEDEIKVIEAETKSTSSTHDFINGDSSDEKTGLILDNGALRELNIMTENNEKQNIFTKSQEDKIKETEEETKSTSSSHDVINGTSSDDKTGLILEDP
ncbi:uncharacterized protein LOC127729798 [Mytilus californianus]|uniref:uncharacterized protein LOC127729798 n=1 Tax=Mytilus californianus TaxID=6549 RepID=UPI002246398A|nr:uncharacterized protein LOC127729798 [Mytilus californianus]